MRIIPAIDILDGKCVRLSKGDYASSKVYNANPLEVAKEFEAHGIRYLHVVDLDGAKSKQIVHHRILEQICSNTNLQVDFGGGIKSQKDVALALDSGAKQVTVGSVAAKQPELFLEWLTLFGSDRIILGADCTHGKIASSGWLEVSDQRVVPFIQSFEQKGVKHVVCTDIQKDGMLAGPAFELYQQIISTTSVSLIASGGVSSVDDLRALEELGCFGAIVGKALYEGSIKLKALEQLC